MKIHFVGIGGVGMAALAVLLKSRGHDVTGCDLAETPRTKWLEAKGIHVFVGHDVGHVNGMDEVIVTPAVHPDAPERLAAGGRVRLRGDVLARLVSDSSDSIAVCGSHGKTTTSTWIARLLLALGENVSWAIGGETGDFPVGGGDARGVLVVEADESDGTLEKYHATTLVVTNCEYDHPDHFKTRDDYLACFARAKANAREVLDDPAALESLAAPLGLDALHLAPHNRRNALMAAEVARRRGHDLTAIAAALPAIVATLPDRRFQKVAAGVYTDYAHHPTEMACAVSMARAVAKGTLRVLFQPHRFSRTKALLHDFPAAFKGADEVVLCPTYAAFESPIAGGTIASLYAALRAAWADEADAPRLLLARSCDEAWEHARNAMKEGDLTLLLGAGDIVRLLPKVKDDLARRSRGESFARRRVWIGGGTNLWKSDLDLSVDYVKTTGRAGRPGSEIVKAHPTLCPWMAGIPGTIGGWVKMNAGAFGHSFSEVLDAVKVDGVWMAAKDCGFGYRTSAITGEIQDVRLKKEDAFGARGNEEVQDYLARRAKFPPGTFGSVFKNPPNDFAGRLLEEALAKTLRVGGAFVWEGHANVIVRGANATPSDVLALASLMREAVFFKTGVRLDAEVVGL